MYKQYQLPYAYEALEPHIDALTMETHYSRHHAAYTKNLNDAAEQAGVAGRDITELLANLDSIADSGRQTAAVCQSESGQPDHRRQRLCADPRLRCLGTRLLPEI